MYTPPPQEKCIYYTEEIFFTVLQLKECGLSLGWVGAEREEIHSLVNLYRHTSPFALRLEIESWGDKWVFLLVQISYFRLANCLFMVLLMDVH